MTVASVFDIATGETPYPWQSGLAERNEPAVGITAPTGAGKTEAVVFDWLWRRRLSGDPAQRAATPRRLLLTLPMRVLVEQTHRRVLGMVERLAEAALLDPEDPVRVSVLMGGALDKGWSNHPAADQIIVATIDQALSRALNRGYGRSRGLWPIDFGLVNTDTRWVIDEVQLLDAALATSSQLAGLRANGHRQSASTCWMSATLDPGWLETIDHEAPNPDLVHGLTAQDRDGPLRNRLDAPKRLVRMEIDPEQTEQVEAIVLDAHARARPSRTGGPGWLTIAMVNTVARAQALHARLARLQHEFDLVLLHSRFRPADRRRLTERLDDPVPPGGRVLVTTQVIEAGVDLDAAALVTELAPWASMVQRAGRLNRAGGRGRQVGDADDPRLVWLDPPGDLDARTARPYEEAQLERCRSVLRENEASSFSPSAVDATVASQPAGSLLTPPPRGLLLRRPDLLALFDTDPTLDGDDDDVGRFIRLGEDLDLTVAWRANLPAGGPTSKRDMPAHEEQCAVPIRDSKALLALEPWRWSYTERRWSRMEAAARLLPGDQLLVDARRGGYSTTTGWTPGLRGAVDPIAPSVDATLEADSDSDDSLSEGAWVTIADHTDAVVGALEADLLRLDLSPEEAEALRLAARWHDAGKAHKTFQERLGVDVPDLVQPPWRDLWAKAPPGDGKRPTRVFRHEVASALLLADAHELDEPRVQLAVYLIGAHHGKLRLTPRLEPLGERSDKRTCMGVADGDAIPQSSERAIDLGGGVQVSEAVVDLSLFDLGAVDRPTWTEMALDLLDRHGAFRLGYLEALLRAADHRVSATGPRHG